MSIQTFLINIIKLLLFLENLFLKKYVYQFTFMSLLYIALIQFTYMLLTSANVTTSYYY